VPKEFSVAADLFGQENASQDTSQVRVHIYHLRKKLEQYFGQEGKQETLVLTIPKGGYQVEVNRRSAKGKGSGFEKKRFVQIGLLADAIVRAF